MSKLFSELEKERQRQHASVKTPLEPTNAVAHKLERDSAHLLKPMSEPLSNGLSNFPSTEDIENLAFRIRKLPKQKVNTEIPLEWKKTIDDLAHTLRVGKYDLLMYILARFLGEAGEGNPKP
jgi:hypothetical protein